MINFEEVAEINKNVSWTLIGTEFENAAHSLRKAVEFKLGFIFQPIMNCVLKHTKRHSADLMYDVNRLLTTAYEYGEKTIKENIAYELMLVGVREFGVDSEGSVFYAMSPDSCLGDVNTRYKGLFRLTFEKCGDEFTFYLWEGKYSPVKVTKEIS